MTMLGGPEASPPTPETAPGLRHRAIALGSAVLRSTINFMMEKAQETATDMTDASEVFKAAGHDTIATIGDSRPGEYNPLRNWDAHVNADYRPNHQVPQHPGRPGHAYEYGDPTRRSGMIGDGEVKRQVALLANRRADRARRETAIGEVHHQAFGHDIHNRRHFWHGLFGGGALGAAQRQEARSARIIDNEVGGETPSRILPRARRRTGRLVKTERGDDIPGRGARMGARIATRVATRLERR